MSKRLPCILKLKMGAVLPNYLKVMVSAISIDGTKLAINDTMATNDTFNYKKGDVKFFLWHLYTTIYSEVKWCVPPKCLEYFFVWMLRIKSWWIKWSLKKMVRYKIIIQLCCSYWSMQGYIINYCIKLIW